MPLENQIIVPKYKSGFYTETVLNSKEILAVSITGDEIISGYKDFYSRPSVNGSGVLLVGEVLNSSSDIVYTTGNQFINGLKTFEQIKTNTILGEVNLGPYCFISGENTYRPPFVSGEIVFPNHALQVASYNPNLFAEEFNESGAYALYINISDINKNNYEYIYALTGADVIFSLKQNDNIVVYKTNSGSFSVDSYFPDIIYNDRLYNNNTALTLIQSSQTEFTSSDPIYIQIGSANFSIINGSGNFSSLKVNNTGVLLENYPKYTPYSETINFVSNKRYSINTTIPLPSNCRVTGFNPTNPDPEMQAYYAENPDSFLADGVYVYDGLINDRPSYKLNINPNWRLEWFLYGDNTGEWRIQNTVTQVGAYGTIYPEHPPDPWGVDIGDWNGLDMNLLPYPYLIVEELKNNFTCVLPGTPEAGDEIEIYDAAGTWDVNPLIIDNNGNYIEQKKDLLECNVRHGLIKLIYTPQNNIGWKIYPMPIHSVPLFLSPSIAITGISLSGIIPFNIALTGVNLLDPSLSPVDEWYWNLGTGDGYIVSGQTINYTYQETGLYNVTLSGVNAAGFDVEQRVIDVFLPLAPIPAISTYTISGYAPLTLSFTGINLQTPAEFSPVDHWYWNVSGDSEPEFDQSVINYTFNETGIYTFYLTATNLGGSGTASGTFTILEVPPEPQYSGQNYSNYTVLELLFNP